MSVIDIEKYRPLKNIKDIEDLMRELLKHEIVLINQLHQLLNIVSSGIPVAAPSRPSPAIRVTELPSYTVPQLRAQGIVSIMYTPIDLLDAETITVSETDLYRYDLATSDLIIIVPLDDTILFSPREFTDNKGAIPLPAGTLFVLRRPRRWQQIYMKAMNQPAKVYISEWVYLPE